MKNTIYFIVFLFVCFLFSCSQEVDVSVDNFDSTPKLKSQGDGKYESLGYGYDITGEFLAAQSTKKQIIDVESFVKKNPHRFDNPIIGIITTRLFGGDDFISYIKDIKKSTNANFSLNLFSDAVEKEKAENAIFSGEFSKNNNEKYSYSTKYSFARADVIKRYKNYYLDSNPSDLSDFLTLNFKEDLELLSADAIVIKYGTHVLTNIEVGGFYKSKYRSVITESSKSITKSMSAKGGLSVLLKKVGLNFGVASSESVNETFASRNVEWNFESDVYGGTRNGYSIATTNEGSITQTSNFDNWSASVDNTSSVLIDVNWAETYPIFDFVKDPTKKELIKEAVKKYILSKEVKMMNIVPLEKYYNSKMQNDNVTISDTERAMLLNSGYTFITNIGYIFPNQELGTIPLYKVYSAKMQNDNLTTSINERNQFLQSGYKYIGIVGYIYPTQKPNTVPLYKYYNSKMQNDNFSIFDTEIKDVWKGYTYIGILGYVYPSIYKK